MKKWRMLILNIDYHRSEFEPIWSNKSEMNFQLKNLIFVISGHMQEVEVSDLAQNFPLILVNTW